MSKCIQKNPLAWIMRLGHINISRHEPIQASSSKTSPCWVYSHEFVEHVFLSWWICDKHGTRRRSRMASRWLLIAMHWWVAPKCECTLHTQQSHFHTHTVSEAARFRVLGRGSNWSHGHIVPWSSFSVKVQPTGEKDSLLFQSCQTLYIVLPTVPECIHLFRCTKSGKP